MLLETEAWRPRRGGVERSLGGLGFMSRDMLSSVCRDFRRIIVAMIVTLALAVGAAVLVPPRYVADATLLVLLSPDYGTRQVAGGVAEGGGGMMDRDSFLKSEVEIMSSRALLAAALDRIGGATMYPELYGRPSLMQRAMQVVLGQAPGAAHAAALDRFGRHFDASADKTGDILQLAFRDRDPVRAARALNTIIAVYLERRAALYRDVQSGTLAAQADDLRRRLDRADQDFAAFKARAGIVNYDTQRELLLRQHDDLTRDLQQGESAAAQAAQSRAAASAQLAGTPQDVVISDEQDTRRAAELARVGATSVGSTTRRGRSTVYESLNLDRARAAIGLQAAHARHDTDVQQLATVQTALDRLETNEVELERQSRARGMLAQEYQSVAKALADRRLVESVESGRDSNVRIIQPAEAPDRPTNLRLVVLAAGILLSLFMGVAVAVLANLFRRGYISPEALERRLGVPVLASIPDLTRLDHAYDRLSDYGPVDG